MFLKISELEGGHQIWYDLALKLLYAGSGLPHNGASETLSEPSYWEAKLALDIVLELCPNWSAPYYQRGVAFAALAAGVWSSPMTACALKDFERALRLDPTTTETYQARARLLAKKHPQRAIADLSQLIALRPTVESYVQRARLRLVTGDTDGTVADYLESLRRYVGYCGVQEQQVIEGYLERLTREWSGGNRQGVINSLVTFWDEHSLIRYQ